MEVLYSTIAARKMGHYGICRKEVKDSNAGVTVVIPITKEQWGGFSGILNWRVLL